MTQPEQPRLGSRPRKAAKFGPTLVADPKAPKTKVKYVINFSSNANNKDS